MIIRIRRCDSNSTRSSDSFFSVHLFHPLYSEVRSLGHPLSAMSSEKYQPPPVPPPGRQLQNPESYSQPLPGPPPSWTPNPTEEQYQPPSGPPPGTQTKQQEAQYVHPSGPPPAWSPPQYEQHYAPPPGPPPSHQPQTVTPSYQGIITSFDPDVLN